MTRINRSLALGCALLFAVLGASAEEIRDYYAEPGINPFKESINQHFNEHVDPFSGTLQLKYTDLSIPGNGGMDINVSRVYTSLQTNQYPTLGLNGLGWTMHFGRIVTSRNHADKLCNQGAFPLTTAENPSLELPDGGRELLVLNHISNDNTLITRSNWRAQCGSNGIGLVVTSPDGTRYTMNQFDAFQGEPSWLTTRIDDLEGNWIRIDYQVNSVGISYIDKVFRSEEGETSPVVTYEYESQNTADIKLAAVTANGQRVLYRYEVIPGFLYPFYKQLVEVVRPDGRSWSYTYNPKLGDPDPNDDVLEDGLASYSLIHVGYPHGGTIDYTYQRLQFDPGSALPTTSILSKSVAGTGVPNGQWTYTFAPFSFPYPDSFGGQLRYDVTTVTGPTDTLKFYHYGKDYRGGADGVNVFVRPSFTGILAMKEIYSTGGGLLERTGYTWLARKISNEAFVHGAAYRAWWRENGTYVPIPAAEFTNRDSRASATTYNHYVQYFEHDAYGNPHRVLESSNLNNRPATQRLLTYFIDTTKWILHVIDDEVHQSGSQTVGEIARTFNANGKVLRQEVFGVETNYTYNDDGDVASIEDARGKIRRYSNYKRGIAQLERLPESVTVERVVNDTGTVQSETNGRGYSTSFQYDSLNRLTAIDFPIKSDVSIDYGVASGGYRRTLTRGNYRQAEVITDFGQVLRIERADAAAGHLVYRTKDYDASGREVFTSYPNSGAGITTSYDALGRITRTQHPDGTGVNYVHDDSSVTVTNERGYATNYLYHIRGSDFGARSLAFIAAPQKVGTIIQRDAFDNPTQVFQGELLSDGSVRGYGKLYEYDARLFLVRATEPEVGTTVFTHDAVGNVLSQRVNAADPIAFVYDDLNRRTLTDFPGTALDVVTEFDRNGNLEEVAKGTTRSVYDYDENDNLLSETLSITDPLFGARSYVTSHGYNNQDVAQQVTFPSGLVVDYAPDAFGRATHVGTFATNITYHASGQLQSYQLANGVVTNVALNQRLLPQSIQAGSLLSLGYTYDPVGNVTAIVDGIDSSKSVQMNYSDSYDGQDRLTRARGSWGQARFTYDFYGNMLTKVVGTDNLSNQFDDQRRLHQVRKLNVANPSEEDARIRMSFDNRGNTTSKQRYLFDVYRNVASIDDMQFVYGADSSLIKARVVNRTTSLATPVADKDYLYDGSGQRIVEKKHGTYDIRYSVYSRGGELTFEDSIANCTRTDYIRLGALALARSDDQRADPAADSDGDQINNCMELQLGLNPNNAADANADGDGDGLSNLQELRFGTSLLAGDTDGDGLSDGQEGNQYLTDPTLADSDGDGISDANEALDPRVDPLLVDVDHDGVSDYWELQLGTNPRDPLDGRTDTDGDGFSNRQESMLGVSPASQLKTPARGQKAWTFETFGKVYSAAAIGPDGTVYVSAEENHLYAINPDGTQRWRYTVQGARLFAPTVAPNGTVYLVADFPSYNEIHAINSDGSERWVYSSSEYILDSVVLGPAGRVYFAGYHGVFVQPYWQSYGTWGALNDQGELVAGAATSFLELVWTSPAVDAKGNVYLVDGSGDLRAYDEQGALLWTVDTDAGDAEAPVIDAQQRIYFADDRGRTYAVSPQGQVLWTRQSPDNQTRSTVTIGSDGTLYIGAYDSKLYAVNPADGSTLWTANTFGTAYTPAIGGNGTIYVTTFGGSISAYSPTGTLLWLHKTGTEISAPPVLDRDGMIYFGSRSGQLFAVADNAGGLANTPWPMARHDSAGSGYTCFDGAAYSTTVDSDGDGIDNCTEIKHGLDPLNPNDAALDADGDGLSNSQEHALGTNISSADTDADGLNDGQEVLTHHTDPRRADSDGDSIGDGREVDAGLDPLAAADALLDADGDGFSNRAENWGGSDLTLNSSRPTSGTIVRQSSDNYLFGQAAAVAADGTIYQRSRERAGLEAVNPDLSVKWRWQTPFYDVPVLGADGTIYVLTQENPQRLVALYPNGTERWAYTPDPSLRRFYESPVIGSDGTLFLGARAEYPNEHRIVAFDPLGRVKWDIETGYPADYPPPGLAVGRNGNVVAHTARHGTTMYRADNGQALWNSRGDNYSYYGPRPVIDADGTIYVSTYYGLSGYNEIDGSTVMYYNGASGTPVITSNGLILQSCNNTLCAITRQGTLAWTAPSSGVAGTPVIGANGTIYAGGYQRLDAYNNDGTVQWSTPMDIDSLYQPIVMNDGMIYIADDRFMALVISDAHGLSSTSPWPSANRDYRNNNNASGIADATPSPAPTIAITEPDPFRPLNLDVGEPFTLTAFASDLSDGNLNAAIVWASSIDGPLGNGPTLLSPTLSIGSHIVTASVTDSNGLTTHDSVTVNLGYLAPTLAVHSPVNGDSIERGQSITLQGEADDAIDGDLSDSIQWSSSLDGALGIGRQLTVNSLQAGTHVITATVTDSSNISSMTAVEISIQIIPPYISIYAPYDDSGFEIGTAVEMRAGAYDSVDGDLSDSIQWISNRDGVVGVGEDISVATLTAGIHVLTAQATDSTGAAGSRSVTINIGPQPPYVAVSEGGTFVVAQGENRVIVAGAFDELDGEISNGIRWVSSLDGQVGTGAQFSTATLSGGWHSIVLSVTDSSGLSGSYTISVLVDSWPNSTPTVSFTSPANNAQFFVGDQVRLQGNATDPENGNIRASIQWSSNLDGALGSGSPRNVSTLRIGDHTIKALVADSNGAKAAVTRIIRIRARP